MRRSLFSVCSALSLLLCAAVCVLRVRSRTGYDQMLWAYDRWLSDGSAASNQVELMSGARLSVTIVSGRVGPPNGQLAWGYYSNADESGGRPRLTYHHDRYDAFALLLAGGPDGTVGLGPIRWARSTRTALRDGDDSRAVHIGVSHWFAAALLAIIPGRAAWRAVGRWRRRHSRASGRDGRCAACGYDLRATPDRCPECGLIPAAATG